MNAQTYTQESQHWYSRDGKPVYEVEGAKGQRVRPDIRHAKKLGLLPGYTTIAKVLAEPSLEAYKRRQVLLASLTLTRGVDESDDSFIRRIEEDAKAHAAQRAEEGTAVHKAIEQHLRGESFDPKWTEHVKATKTELDKLPRPFCGDFKTRESLRDKDGKPLPDKALFFDNHIMQLCAYAHGATDNVDSDRYICEQTFASRRGYGGRIDVRSGSFETPPSLVSLLIGIKPCEVRVKTWTPAETDRGLSLFEHALAVWKLRNYDSSF